MSRWLVIAALLLPASSALAASHTATTSAAFRHGATWRVQVLPAGRSFSEPGIAAGRHRILFASACTANANRPATFWRSGDAGRHWSRGFAVGSPTTACGDADTAIGSDGYRYAAILGSGVEIYRTRDGLHWSSPAQFPFPHGSDQPDRPWIVTVPGRPKIVHVFNSEGGGDIVEWTSTDHAATFTGPVLVTGGLNSQAAITLASRPLVDPARPSRIEQFYETAGLGGVLPSVGGGGPVQFPFTQLWRARSLDGGRTWHNTKVVDIGSTFGAGTGTLGHLLPATAIDRTGRVYIVVSVQLGQSLATHLYLLHSAAGGGWSHPVRVDRGTSSNVYPAVAVGRPGKIYISWYASPAGSFTDDSAHWHEMVATTSNALAKRPTFAGRRLGPIAHVGAIEQAGAIGFDLGEDWNLRDFQSIVMDSCGRPHAMWASDYRGAGRVLTASPRGGCPH
ncbi:MAG: hypothetical protein ACTHK4_15035 [Mycobacteriales bacterium]